VLFRSPRVLPVKGRTQQAGVVQGIQQICFSAPVFSGEN
jgi:hypothetical protein